MSLGAVVFWALRAMMHVLAAHRLACLQERKGVWTPHRELFALDACLSGEGSERNRMVPTASSVSAIRAVAEIAMKLLPTISRLLGHLNLKLAASS